MPAFPITDPKQFIITLLFFLKQAYHFLTTSSEITVKTSSATSPKINHDGILTPTLAPNHPQLQQQNKGSTFDEVLNAYNRSKSRKRIESDALLEQQLHQSQYKYDYANDNKLEEHVIIVLRSLISVIKSNAEVEIQCIGNFDMIFGFLANNIFAEVS